MQNSELATEIDKVTIQVTTVVIVDIPPEMWQRYQSDDFDVSCEAQDQIDDMRVSQGDVQRVEYEQIVGCGGGQVPSL